MAIGMAQLEHRPYVPEQLGSDRVGRWWRRLHSCPTPLNPAAQAAHAPASLSAIPEKRALAIDAGRLFFIVLLAVLPGACSIRVDHWSPRSAAGMRRSCRALLLDDVTFEKLARSLDDYKRAFDFGP